MRLETRNATARLRSLWGLLLISLIALALAAVTAPRIHQPKAGAAATMPGPTPTRQAQRRANGLSRPQVAGRLLYLPQISVSDSTMAVSSSPGLAAEQALQAEPVALPTPSPTATATLTPSPTTTPTTTPTATPSPTPTHTPTPYPTPDGQKRRVRVPILMYHYISVPPPDADVYRHDLSVTPANFERQLRYLAENGYTTITLQDLVYHLTLGYPLPERPVILTFDDGYRDNFSHAYRLLRRFHFVGTFFLVTSFIDQNHPDYLTWNQVQLMHQGGMAFGSHTFTHPNLRGQSVDYLVWQIVGSQQAIAERIGEPVRFFAYPAGLYDQQVIDVLHSADFWVAVTTQPGDEHTTDSLFELERIRVRGDDTLEQLATKLNYDWGQAAP